MIFFLCRCRLFRLIGSRFLCNRLFRLICRLLCNRLRTWAWTVDYPLCAQRLQNILYGKTNIVLAEDRVSPLDSVSNRRDTTTDGSSDNSSSGDYSNDDNDNNNNNDAARMTTKTTQ